MEMVQHQHTTHVEPQPRPFTMLFLSVVGLIDTLQCRRLNATGVVLEAQAMVYRVELQMYFGRADTALLESIF